MPSLWVKLYLLCLLAQAPGIYSFLVWIMNIQEGWLSGFVLAVVIGGIVTTLIANIAFIITVRGCEIFVEQREILKH